MLRTRSTGGNAPPLSVTSGDGAGGGVGGNIVVTVGAGGAGGSSTGGTLLIRAGSGSTGAGMGGSATFQGGAAAGGAAAGGVALVQGGNGGGVGGEAKLLGGLGAGTNAGGLARVLGGTGGTGAGGHGGIAHLTGGDAGAGSGGNAGDVVLTPGSPDGAGVAGKISLAGPVDITDAKNITLGTTTGTKFGTATTQKLAFYNSAPIVQGAAVADASGGATIDAEARTAVNSLLARIRSLGLIAT